MSGVAAGCAGTHAAGAAPEPPMDSPPRAVPGTPSPLDGLSASRFVAFSRAQWAALRDQTPLLLTEADLYALRGVNEQVSLAQVEQIYLPLTRLLNLYVGATQALHATTDVFLGRPSAKVPSLSG